MPILANALLTASKGGKLEMAATDLDIQDAGLRRRVRAQRSGP